MIPLRAEPFRPLFFFGTLMDIDILSYVLQRPPPAADLLPARLEGYRRVRAAGTSYPVLTRREGASVEGRLLTQAAPRDIARINHYESEEYRAVIEKVRLEDGTVLEAWTFLAIDAVMEATDEDWDLECWARTHKASFFAACDAWMAGCRD